MNRPLTLPHSHVRLLANNRHITLLILNRRLLADSYEIHDPLTIRRNQQHRSNGRPDLQADPYVLTIEITHSTETTLLDPDLRTIRRTGHRTLEDFYQDWLHRHRRVDPSQRVYLHDFHIAAEARYLHRRVHRGYTTRPEEAAAGEPQALTPAELDDLAQAAARRHAREHHAETVRNQLRSLAIRLKETSRTGDLESAAAIGKEIDRLRDKHAA